MPDHEEKLVGEFPFVPKQERAQQKRNALIESGYALFNSKGYEQTTAKEIAAHAGVATGTFYRYFSDKRQLLMSLLEDKLEKFLPPEPSWMTNDPETVLASLLEAHYHRRNELGLQRVLPELMTKDSELAEVLGVARRKIHDRMLSGLKQASESGLTWPDIDLDTVTWAIMVLVENGLERQNQSGKKVDCQELARVICRMVFPPEVLEHLQKSELEKME
ncbi:TetR/AcrR family transcriptional regulator [Neobacillus sp. MM2021_6]|uniref:TetR/AcrR family transcriptional regulator n=1 Tax=Bacillaceae TaxID=186817 RepID=UPI00140B1504|nr:MULTISPECIES: TetR/AcrR family transcriptional regulator [Bacillaceae]MBO0961084.1 TetR/AcrR family transcriptional regulator [Neobacillus sp. MM2021_6]NHC20678.1 TetR/AcrR family transcriptional regulator [Bacillus sp. MM2020_4]